MSEMRLRQAVTLLGAAQLLLGLSMVFFPGPFFDSVASFGERNDHFIRDYATYYLATGVALLMSAHRPTWRVPVLFVVLLQYALHTLNHLIDIGESDPGWLGPADFVSLLLATALLGYVLHAAARVRT